MRKRLIEKFTKAKEGSFGYTMTELLVVVAIIAIVAAIAIPSVIAISRALKFKRVNDHAKSIFLAAQQNLTELRSDGGLEPVQSAGGAMNIPASVTSFPDAYRGEYVYTTTGTEAFSRILPTGSIDADIRDEQIVIEYNPLTGNVYSVFYYDKNDLNLAGQYPSNLPREKSARKAMMLGYYDGSGLNSSQIELEQTQAVVEFVNGQEGVVRVLVPMPESYFGNFDSFASALQIDLTIYGEYSMALAAKNGQTVEPLVIRMKNAGDKTGCTLDVNGRAVIMEYTIDSLLTHCSFANLASGTQPAPSGESNDKEASLTTLEDESKFVYEISAEQKLIYSLLPGENITIQADVKFEGTGEDLVKIAAGIQSNVNPMFEYLQPGTQEGRYTLAIANGRNLQNLNAIAPTIAQMIESVVFVKDINWNDTVNYYNNNYGSVLNGSKVYSNSNDEAPARALPYFVPIHNAALFGTAKFDYNVQNWVNAIPDGPIKNILISIFNPNSRVPTLTDEFDQEAHAAIVGSDQENNDGIQIRNLNIDSTKNRIGAAFYAGTPDAEIDRFTGLFSYANTSIDGIHVVNPIIKGYYFTDGTKPNNPATGALLGAGGYNTYISNCGTYLDTSDPTYSYTKMMGQTGYSKETAQNWYGVSGQGAVGGLVGYAKSHRTTTGELDPEKDVLAFYNSFAAVNVSGDMREEVQRKDSALDILGISKYYGYSSKDYGYTNGIGGLVGNSELTNFYNCYASGNVRATNTNAAEKFRIENSFLNSMANLFGIELEFDYSGRESSGAGGFVGTSHGTRYTNCFATGTVTGTGSSTDLGIGGFVGVMCVDETFSYGNQNDNNLSNAHVAQRTVFTDCYSAGLVTSDGDPAENFSGANCRIVFDIEEYGAAQVADYYRLLGRHLRYNNNTLPDYEDFYIYKDAYYLSKYLLSEEPNSNNCASPAAYSTLINLPGNHLNRDWIDLQITAVKKVVLYDILGLGWFDKTYGEEYFDKNGKVEEIYVQQYMKGFQKGWDLPTASTTHGYDMTGTFPFSKLASLDYYGDWPSKPLANGIAYYEAYEKNENGSYSRFYHFDRESTSQLKNADDKTVIKDGYAILSSTNGAMTITVNGVSKSFRKGAPDDSYTANNKVYHVYLLTDEQMRAATAFAKTSGQFYVPVTFTQEGTTHTYYFNPNVAKSQVNGSYNHTFTDSNSDGSCDTCRNGLAHEYHLPARKEMQIRSARQFAALSTMPNYIGSDYYYVQKMHIDADLYQWTNADDKNLQSIGSAEKPFNTSYSGLYFDEETLEQKRYSLNGFRVVDTGIFGVIGEEGSVSDLSISCADDMIAGSAEKDSVGILTGVNNGSIYNVELTLSGNVSLTAKTNAGLLAGRTTGSITNCAVTTAQDKTITLTAPNAGGLAGSAEGTIDHMVLTVDGMLEVKDAVNAGGALGHALSTVCDQLVVSVGSVNADADFTGGLAGYAEGCTFTGSTNAGITDVRVDGLIRSTGTASGILGSAKNTILTGMDATFSEISGNIAAGFLGTGENVDATNCNLVITKSVTGTNGAAGVAGTIGSESVFNHVPVILTGASVSADNGNAAGYALEVKARAVVMGQCNVTLGIYEIATGSDGTVTSRTPKAATVIRASGNAAGYACSVAGSVGDAHVAGCGQILGENAAGFVANVTGNVANAYVSPALSQDDAGYIYNSNANLTVTGTSSAAGFVLNVEQDATISTAYTLCTVSSSGMIQIEKAPKEVPTETTEPQMENVTSVYGFGGTNNGTISRCMANVDITGGFAFVGINDGLVTTSYGWHSDGVKESDTSKAAMIGSGNCYSSYFADLTPKSHSETSVVVYDADGTGTLITPAALQGTELNGFTTGYGASPYTEMNPPEYLYPMIRNHYGDWVTPPQYAYGVAYYEFYSDNTVKLHMVDLSNSTITEEGNVTFPEHTFTPTGEITQAGYARFYNAASGEHEGTKVYSHPIGDFTYDFYAMEEDGVVPFKVLLTGSHSAVVDTRFANAIEKDVQEFPAGYFFKIRTPQQLSNIMDRTDADFQQTHDIVITDVVDADGNVTEHGTFTTVDSFTGTYDARYGDTCLSITVSNGTTWMTQLSGTVKNLSLNVTGAVTEPIFGTVSGTLNSIDVRCAGTAESMIGTMDGTEEKISSLADVDLNITGPVENFTSSGLLVNALGSHVDISNCDVTAGSIALNAASLPESEAGGIPSKPFGCITGVVPVGVTLSDNTVSATLNVNGADGTLSVIGGLVGINAGTVSGGSTNVPITYKQTALSNTDDQAGIGGLVGWMLPGSSLANTSSSGAISLSEGGSGANRDWYFIGGAVGFDGGATYNGVSTTSMIDEKWAGANLEGEIIAYVGETPEQAAAAVCPAGFGPVGKFVGYVSSNSNYQNCSAIGSGTTKAYQFLGQIGADSQALAQTSLALSHPQSMYSFTVESGTFEPAAEPNWTEWYSGTKYGTDYEYRVFSTVLNICQFDLPGNTTQYQQILDVSNFDFYIEDTYKHQTFYNQKIGAPLTVNTKTITIKCSDMSSYTSETKLPYYHIGNNDSLYYPVYVKYSKGSWGRITVVFTAKDSSGSTKWTVTETGSVGQIWDTVDLVQITEPTNSNSQFAVVSTDGTKILSVSANKTISAENVTKDNSGVIYFAENPYDISTGSIWTYTNNTLKFAKDTTVTKTASVILNASSYDSSTLYAPYSVDGMGEYYLYSFSELNHWYIVTFVPSGEFNHICSYESTN